MGVNGCCVQARFQSYTPNKPRFSQDQKHLINRKWSTWKSFTENWQIPSSSNVLVYYLWRSSDTIDKVISHQVEYVTVNLTLGALAVSSVTPKKEKQPSTDSFQITGKPLSTTQLFNVNVLPQNILDSLSPTSYMSSALTFLLFNLSHGCSLILTKWF